MFSVFPGKGHYSTLDLDSLRLEGLRTHSKQPLFENVTLSLPLGDLGASLSYF